jgi:hypothetical protein
MYDGYCEQNGHAVIERGFCPRCHQLVVDGEVVPGTIQLGQVVIEFRPVPVSISISGSEWDGSANNRAAGSYDHSDQEVRISGRVLRVNDREYGEVNAGDYVTVEHDVITVNGAKRRPVDWD